MPTSSENDPVALVGSCVDALNALPDVTPNQLASAPPSDAEHSKGEGQNKGGAQGEATASLAALRRLLIGEAGAAPDPARVDAAAEAAADGPLLEALVMQLPKLTWQGGKEAALVWGYLLPHASGQAPRQPGDESAAGRAASENVPGGGRLEGDQTQGQAELKALAFVEDHLKLLDCLVEGYCSPNRDLALHSGLMLRDTLRSEKCTRHVLETGLHVIIQTCEAPNFDVATEAFTTLKDLLRRHKKCAALYLDHNFDKFFGLYHELLLSETYVTRRQAAKILGELLLDRSNLSVMLRYIGAKENLKIIMTLLKDESKAIQKEAFDVFKIFVANPKRPEEVTKVLQRNKQKLVHYLQEFQPDKEEEDFDEEKETVIAELQEL